MTMMSSVSIVFFQKQRKSQTAMYSPAFQPVDSDLSRRILKPFVDIDDEYSPLPGLKVPWVSPVDEIYNECFTKLYDRCLTVPQEATQHRLMKEMDGFESLPRMDW